MQSGKQIQAAFSEQELSLLILGLGELQTKYTFLLVKRLEKLLEGFSTNDTAQPSVDSIPGS
jgi:hypothetical protein